MGRSQPQPCRADPSQRGESLPRPSPFNPPGTRGSHRHKAHRARPEGEGPPPRPHPGPSRLPGIPPPPHSAQHPRLSPHCEIHCSKKHGPELLLPRGSWPPPTQDHPTSLRAAGAKPSSSGGRVHPFPLTKDQGSSAQPLPLGFWGLLGPTTLNSPRSAGYPFQGSHPSLEGEPGGRGQAGFSHCAQQGILAPPPTSLKFRTKCKSVKWVQRN